MTVAKGRDWGVPGRLPEGAPLARSDAEAMAAIAAARLREAPAVVGLVAGDLCRTLGGTGDVDRMRNGQGIVFPVDVGVVEAEGTTHRFIAHAVAHSRLWRTTVAAANAEWIGSWDVAPRAHPGDGLLDVIEARLELGDLRKVRARLPRGDHMPHPRIVERRVRSATVDLGGRLPLWIDGVRVGRVRVLRVSVEPDAAKVVV